MDHRQNSDEKIPEVEPGFFSYENLKSLGILALVVFMLRSSIASPYHVPTPSMVPTIKPGDRILANKMAYDFKIPFTDISIFKMGDIKRGDIVVFSYPKDVSLDYVKRVVGLPGDKLKVIDDIIYVNDVAQPRVDFNQDKSVLDDVVDEKELYSLFKETLGEKEHWVQTKIPSVKHFSQSTFPSTDSFYTVPEDSLFVMGDNRDNSADSRVWGKVPLSYVKGRALFVLWSVYFEDNSFLPRFRFKRFGKFLDTF